ncbi:ABSCISIC ACID-INSENSITIVE 5-like protein 3 isoform X1 [Quercus suber]|uniref:Abscisic acid-insensitive 5-like protein 2 n=1 Tax=Quercus suber TaxID=58331 RepID=A0AAW0KWE3_QUESU|nr:ABSCISIC ACID-INSENSITIVE 5-like protein 3 [Quercus suber]
MGIQTMGTQGNGQQVQQPHHLQPSPLTRQSSWYSLTLDEIKNHLGDTGKPVGSMNLDELLQNVWTTEMATIDGEANQIQSNESTSSSSSSLQRQASLTLARALSGKTVDQVWREIQQGQRKRCGGGDIKVQGLDDTNSSVTLGETTLEDFLVQAGLFAEPSIAPPPPSGMGIVEVVTPQKMVLSSSPSFGTLSDTPMQGQKRDASDAFERTLDRRQRRKIKNRESAARSRARKQAYHNELVSKVSRLEEENIKLKKEKEFDQMLSCEPPRETKYQLRRTSSASF